ncbi:IS1380 family transposase, partial [Hahella ganghwensis]|uniref:IS1380 family transposase n=1 Tax=Hahella ganghwensis TaxID=286420 RepID=UPI00037B23DF
MLPESLSFSPLQRRLIQAQFSGGHITSDAGLLLLREIDQKAGISLDLAHCVPDERQAEKIQHPMLDLMRQRLYSLACGYEDLNDHDSLRDDHAFQTALNRMTPLASKATLGRMEQRVERTAVIEAHRAMWERFVASYAKPPKRVVLDLDASDIPVHGNQEGRYFRGGLPHGYYDHYCFLPLYVFCGRQPLVSYLRPSNIDAARHSWAITALLVKFL